MQTIDQVAVNTLRFLSIDEVEKAKSGHPGFPLGTAFLLNSLKISASGAALLRAIRNTALLPA